MVNWRRASSRAAAKYNLRVAIEQTGASRDNELDALFLSRNRLYDGLILSTVGLDLPTPIC